jgi:hypothetical protein
VAWLGLVAAGTFDLLMLSSTRKCEYGRAAIVHLLDKFNTSVAFIVNQTNRMR